MVLDVVEATKTKLKPARTLLPSVRAVFTHFKDRRSPVTAVVREDLFQGGSPTTACEALKAVLPHA